MVEAMSISPLQTWVLPGSMPTAGTTSRLLRYRSFLTSLSNLLALQDIQIVAVFCLGQPRNAGRKEPRHAREGSGGVTERTGQGLMRLTRSVIPPLKICLSRL